MKKLIVSALAIYGGIKLGEKLLKKYREPIIDWVGRKAEKLAKKLATEVFDIAISNKKEETEEKEAPFMGYSGKNVYIADKNPDHFVVRVKSYKNPSVYSISSSFMDIAKENGCLSIFDVCHMLDVDTCMSDIGYGWTSESIGKWDIECIYPGYYEIRFPKAKKL